MTHRYSLRVGIIRSSVLIACTALAVSCAQSAPLTDHPLVSAHVIVSRIISENVPPRPSDCTIGTLTAMPAQPYRELGSIQVSDAGPDAQYVRTIVDHFACKMGADAVVMNQPPALATVGTLEVTAVAYESGLANRAAQAPAAASPTDLNDESHGPFAQFPEAQIIPASASDESPTSPDSSSPSSTSPSTPVPSEIASPTPSAPLTISPSPTATASPTATPLPTSAATPSLTPTTSSPTAAATETSTPSVTPATAVTLTPGPSSSPTGGELLPLSPSKIVPDDDPDRQEDPDKDNEPDSAPASLNPAATSSPSTATSP